MLLTGGVGGGDGGGHCGGGLGWLMTIVIGGRGGVVPHDVINYYLISVC